MRVLYSVVCILLLSKLSYGQLTNGSFEVYTAIPDGLGQWSRVVGWTNAGSSVSNPDYYHKEANNIADLPETPVAIVDAADGNAIIGLAICGKVGSNKRSYLQHAFESPLVPGQEYHLCFRITNGEQTATSHAGLASNHIGIALSTTALIQIGDAPIQYEPQLKIDHVLYLDRWQTIYFSFVADQPYSHMTFGLFNNDEHHSIESAKGNNSEYAYYFVDDFRLSTEPPVEEPVIEEPIYFEPPNAPFFVPNAFTPNGDGDNDVFIPVAGYIKEWTLEIYTKWGDPVFVSTSPLKGWDGTCMGKPCANGSYIWKMTFHVPGTNGELREAVEYGFVNLVK
ncbi:MAG TPA: gliding motility-associated C-terminal domain-containing protein [Flavobacteriales bacterium]